MSTREDFLREMIEDYRRRIERYQANIAEWERELGAPISSEGGSLGTDSRVSAATLPPGADPTSIIRQFEFATKSQPEAAKLFLERFGKPLTTDEIMAGLEKGGVKLGGGTPEKKKGNLATILTRADGIVRVGRGAWALGTKKPKNDSEKNAKPEGESKAETQDGTK